MVIEEVAVAIVGAGPAGLATAASLNHLFIPNIVFEREDCSASLWKKRAYDRLKLHLSKEFCNLPHRHLPRTAPRFVPKDKFVEYLDDYASHFKINIRFNRSIVAAFYDQVAKRWCIKVRNTESGKDDEYWVKYLVVATGENGEGVVPEVGGLDGFDGEWLHSDKYNNGLRFADRDVLVVGSGNSGMEIAYDLSNYGANTSIVIRSPTHILTAEMVYIGMSLLKRLPCSTVDKLVMALSKIKYGNLSKYGIYTPKKGPFYLKKQTGRSPTIDVGAVEKIKQGKIKVFSSNIEKIDGHKVTFRTGEFSQFDAIIFATGYRSTVRDWLNGGDDLFDENGMPIPSFPNHWKGSNGLYCVGFSRRGLLGITSDALNVACDIDSKWYDDQCASFVDICL